MTVFNKVSIFVAKYYSNKTITRSSHQLHRPNKNTFVSHDVAEDSLDVENSSSPNPIDLSWRQQRFDGTT